MTDGQVEERVTVRLRPTGLWGSDPRDRPAGWDSGRCPCFGLGAESLLQGTSELTPKAFS